MNNEQWIVNSECRIRLGRISIAPLPRCFSTGSDMIFGFRALAQWTGNNVNEMYDELWADSTREWHNDAELKTECL